MSKHFRLSPHVEPATLPGIVFPNDFDEDDVRAVHDQIDEALQTVQHYLVSLARQASYSLGASCSDREIEGEFIDFFVEKLLNPIEQVADMLADEEGPRPHPDAEHRIGTFEAGVGR